MYYLINYWKLTLYYIILQNKVLETFIGKKWLCLIWVLIILWYYVIKKTYYRQHAPVMKI